MDPQMQQDPVSKWLIDHGYEVTMDTWLEAAWTMAKPEDGWEPEHLEALPPHLLPDED